MIITTWKELKPVHKLVSHLDHLNHCPIHYKNEVIQMKQTVRFGAIKNVFGKIQHLRARVPKRSLAILDLPYLKLGIWDFKAKSRRDSGLNVCLGGGYQR